MKKLIALTLALAGPVFADTWDYSHKWGIGGGYGYNTPVFGNDLNHEADGGETWDFHLRYHFGEHSLLELAYAKFELDNTELAPQVADLTWAYRLSGTKRFTPLIGLGLGVADVLHYEEDSLKLAGKLRLGIEYAITRHITTGINVDYQHIDKMVGEDNLDLGAIDLLAARLGVTIYFGGVETGGGAATAAAAAAAASTVVAQEARDVDSDGVVDANDKCPNTLPDSQVNAYGCSKDERGMVKLDVKFALDKAKLDHNYNADLKALAAFAKENPTTKLEIQGHTDSSGNTDHNKKLSLDRAEAVKEYLVIKENIDATRLVTSGHGEAEPVAANETKEGRKENRRVIAIITE